MDSLVNSLRVVTLPGRMAELELFGVEVEYTDPFRVVSFTFFLDQDARHLVEVTFDIDKKFWWVFMDNAHFDKIPCETRMTLTEHDALHILQIVLTEFNPKSASGISALKNWRNKLQVWPAKLLTLKK